MAAPRRENDQKRTAGLEKAKARVAKIENAPAKKVESMSSGGVGGETLLRSTDPMKGTVNEYKQFVRSTDFRPTVEGTSDMTGEIRGFKVEGNKNKNFKKNVAKAENRAKSFIDASDQGKLFEGR